MWAKSIPAFIGLLGVLIGAFITSGIAYLGDRNHRRADNRVAERLVASEIRTDMLLLHDAYRYGRIVEPLHFNDWRSQRATLARYLNGSSWDVVNQFYVDAASFSDLLTSERCALRVTRDNAFANVQEGNSALVRLGFDPVSLGHEGQLRCR
jgi:hypothetical protein